MGVKNRFTIFILSIFLGNIIYAQVDNEELIQFSGIVVTADSIRPVPYTNIVIKRVLKKY